MTATPKKMHLFILDIMIVLLLFSLSLPTIAKEYIDESLYPPLSDTTSSHSYRSNWGVFDSTTKTVSVLFENTTIEEYLSMFENIGNEKKVVILKDGSLQTSGYLEEGMIVRCYSDSTRYIDYTLVELKALPENPSFVATPQNTSTNIRSITNSYGFSLPLDGMNLIDNDVDPNGHITSSFGYRNDPFTGEPGDPHNGVDICWTNIYGTPIKAVYGGTVTVLYDGGGYGNYVFIDHGLVNGEYLKTVYAHMSSVSVSDGQIVTQGQVIGYVGNTRSSTAPHLHFEVRVGAAPSMYSCTPVNPIPYLTGAGNAPPDGSPVGSYDGVTADSAKVRVYGWAFDPNNTSSSIRIHVYIGGPSSSADAIGYSVGATNTTRTDVNEQYNISGTHGFDYTILTTKRGTQEIYVYAINIGEGTNTLLGHKTVTITGNPVGNYESATAGVNTVTVKGWAFDYDNPSASISIHVYIGGKSNSPEAEGHSLGATDILRNDVNNSQSISGVHGFQRTITTNKRGEQEVYVYAIDINNGFNTLLGHKTVTITGNPVGYYESVTGGVGTISVKGWAFDYDAPSTSINIHVYIGGPSSSPNATGYNIGLTNITRNDVNNTYNISGAHGFNKTISTTKTGTQEVYVYAINVGAGTHTLLGSKTVTIT